MNIKNKAATFFTIIILIFLAFILYWGAIKPVDVIIQAGHEGRTSGNTGAEFKQYREEEWNIFVADEVAKQLRQWKIEVKRMPAQVKLARAQIAIAIHFDGARRPCASGASIGYPNQDSYDFAQRWKQIYSHYFPYKWHKDNFTPNLKNYYAYHWIKAEKFLILELGELTCAKQTRWLKPRLKNIAQLIAYSIATELGKNIKKPSFKSQLHKK